MPIKATISNLEILSAERASNFDVEATYSGVATVRIAGFSSVPIELSVPFANVPGFSNIVRRVMTDVSGFGQSLQTAAREEISRHVFS